MMYVQHMEHYEFLHENSARFYSLIKMPYVNQMLIRC